VPAGLEFVLSVFKVQRFGVNGLSLGYAFQLGICAGGCGCRFWGTGLRASPRVRQRDHPGDHPRDHQRDHLRDRAGGASLVSTPEKAEVISTMQKRWGAWGGVPLGGAHITPDALVRYTQPQLSWFAVKGLGFGVPRYLTPTHPPKRLRLSKSCLNCADHAELLF
jgi:hypothetical protein